MKNYLSCTFHSLFREEDQWFIGFDFEKQKPAREAGFIPNHKLLITITRITFLESRNDVLKSFCLLQT